MNHTYQSSTHAYSHKPPLYECSFQYHQKSQDPVNVNHGSDPGYDYDPHHQRTEPYYERHMAASKQTRNDGYERQRAEQYNYGYIDDGDQDETAGKFVDQNVTGNTPSLRDHKHAHLHNHPGELNSVIYVTPEEHQRSLEYFYKFDLFILHVINARDFRTFSFYRASL